MLWIRRWVISNQQKFVSNITIGNSFQNFPWCNVLFIWRKNYNKIQNQHLNHKIVHIHTQNINLSGYFWILQVLIISTWNFSVLLVLTWTSISLYYLFPLSQDFANKHQCNAAGLGSVLMGRSEITWIHNIDGNALPNGEKDTARHRLLYNCSLVCALSVFFLQASVTLLSIVNNILFRHFVTAILVSR